MNRALARRPQRISLSWLLWLALLLPLAQTAAAWHEMSHVAEQAAPAPAGKQGLHNDACGLCLVSAAVHGGGFAATPTPLALADVAQSAPAARTLVPPATAPRHAYRSRAPPSASC